MSTQYWSFSVIKEKSSRYYKLVKTPRMKDGRMLLKVRVNGRTAGTLVLSQTEINDFRRRFGGDDKEPGEEQGDRTGEPGTAGRTETEEALGEVEERTSLPQVQESPTQ